MLITSCYRSYGGQQKDEGEGSVLPNSVATTVIYNSITVRIRIRKK